MKQKNSEELSLFNLEIYQGSTSSLSDSLAKICQLLDKEEDSKHHEAVYSLRQCESSGIKNPDISSLKMSKVFSQATKDMTLSSVYKRLPTLGMMVNGNYLIHGGFSPKTESEYSLSDILEENVGEKYFLSQASLNRVKEKWGEKFLPALQQETIKE